MHCCCCSCHHQRITILTITQMCVPVCSSRATDGRRHRISRTLRRCQGPRGGSVGPLRSRRSPRQARSLHTGLDHRRRRHLRLSSMAETSPTSDRRYCRRPPRFRSPALARSTVSPSTGLDRTSATTIATTSPRLRHPRRSRAITRTTATTPRMTHRTSLPHRCRSSRRRRRKSRPLRTPTS